jgi:signal peptidase I
MGVESEQRSASGCELVAEVARRFGEVRFRATGISMMPVIWPGDILTIRQCGMADLQPGQIVLYQRGKELVAHRVTRIHDNLLTTRGDSICHDDLPIPESEIVGQVVSIVRRGRTVPCHLSFWSRAGSRILRRSRICMRTAALLAYRPASFGK